jgi:hypothetical protein
MTMMMMITVNPTTTPMIAIEIGFSAERGEKIEITIDALNILLSKSRLFWKTPFADSPQEKTLW